ncbi:hypothetical protein Adt_33278 [Abeliophyllum distichum]|uniref:Uncharacterized protein n=1 Tax=Abeliophyllum distichum TaxID=126358 RepID=A0ABD1QVT0_9LAMI
MAEASKSEEHRNALEFLQAVKIEACKAKAGKLRKSLENFDRIRDEAKARVTKLLDEKKGLEGKLEKTEADFTINFHHTEAYISFSNFFANVGHQEVIAALRLEHPDLDHTSLEAKFPPVEIEDKSDAFDPLEE